MAISDVTLKCMVLLFSLGKYLPKSFKIYSWNWIWICGFYIYCDLFKIWKLYRVVNRISALPIEYLNRLKCKCPLTHRDSLSRIMHRIQTFVYIIEIQRKQWYKINMSIENTMVSIQTILRLPLSVFTCGESFIKPKQLGKFISSSVNFPSNGNCTKWKTSM